MANPATKGKVTLAGAGPGDPELITVKALKAIECADVILYDALVNTELLVHAGDTCKLIYVGKRKGKKEFSQDEINALLVFYSQRYRYVLRLKGGDPYVFGRGHEELEHAVQHGIEVDVIPGISSALAAPGAVGIPVTKRGVNESFWVITGMLASGEFSADLHLAARSTATVVILMGMTHLNRILELFQDHRGEAEPVAVIQYATLPGQRMITGNVSTIGALAVEHAIIAPAVIVIGKVVEERAVTEMLSRYQAKLKVAP